MFEFVNPGEHMAGIPDEHGDDPKDWDHMIGYHSAEQAAIGLVEGWVDQQRPDDQPRQDEQSVDVHVRDHAGIIHRFEVTATLEWRFVAQSVKESS